MACIAHYIESKRTISGMIRQALPALRQDTDMAGWTSGSSHDDACLHLGGPKRATNSTKHLARFMACRVNPAVFGLIAGAFAYDEHLYQSTLAPDRLSDPRVDHVLSALEVIPWV